MNIPLGSTTQGNQPETLRRGRKGAQKKGNQDATQENHMKTLRRGQRINLQPPARPICADKHVKFRHTDKSGELCIRNINK